MGTFRVEVQVALARPPRADATIFFTLDATDGYDAELLALRIAAAHPRVVMPVGSVVTDWPASTDRAMRT